MNTRTNLFSGKSEIFGTFSYTTTAGKLAPMFVNEDASVFAFFAEVCYTGDPLAILIRETRKGVTKEIKRTDGSITPYIGMTTFVRHENPLQLIHVA